MDKIHTKKIYYKGQIWGEIEEKFGNCFQKGNQHDYLFEALTRLGSGLDTVKRGSLVQPQIVAGQVSSDGAGHDQTNQDHDFFPPRLGLIFQGFLGVVGSPGSVLNRALHVSVDPVDHFALVLYQHGDVHEHLVELLDALLQLDEHLVSLLDVVQGLSELVHVSLNLDMSGQPSSPASLRGKN